MNKRFYEYTKGYFLTANGYIPDTGAVPVNNSNGNACTTGGHLRSPQS